MNDSEKKKQLQRHKAVATGLFIAMMLVYGITVWILKSHPAGWLRYVNAFAEAAMVGALADWFAVTALFHHPLGLPIPHTNLIERSKQSIGDNLANFVVNNFLTPGSIRPYMLRLKVSSYAAEWLSVDKNKRLLVSEGQRLVKDILLRLDDATVAGFIARKGSSLLKQIKVQQVAAGALQYVLDNREQERPVTLVAGKIRDFILENETLVREKVKAESPFFVPGFVDKKLAEKITQGLAAYFGDIAGNPQHRVRAELDTALAGFIGNLKADPAWDQKLQGMVERMLPPEKLEQYALAVWHSLKETLVEELGDADSALGRYLIKAVDDFAGQLRTDVIMQTKIDGWIRFNAYRYIMRNRQQVGTLISNTVGGWEGRELSEKLELEVGKDLQFIRINGTLVGGLVGMAIHALTELMAGG